jgi:hypothetical protein
MDSYLTLSALTDVFSTSAMDLALDGDAGWLDLLIDDGAHFAPDVALLRKVLEHIEANPENWDQETWRGVTECGTAMCFAGWTCELSGGNWVYSAGSGSLATLLTIEPGDDPAYILDSDESGSWVAPTIAARWRAARLLGIDHGIASVLFSSTNTLTHLRWMVDTIAARAEELRAAETGATAGVSQ